MGNQQNMNDQLRVRREKMQELRAEGIDPFGHRFIFECDYWCKSKVNPRILFYICDGYYLP